MSDDWWKKMRKEIPGCGKFKDKGLQNEDELKIMFEDLRNTGDDHFCASSGVIPQSPNGGSNGGDEEAESDDDSEPEEITPSGKGKGKRPSGDDKDKGKRAKTSGGKWIEDQISKIVSLNERSTASVESMARREDNSGCSIKEVMAIVKECGAIPGTKQHFIASELFTKRAEREMFMTLDTPEDRFAWLTMKHFVKYGPV
ncbi:zinc finger CCCH domain-containing protein 43-like [Phragmites australis]|uniref:zinc finger CCCH domain-containing protein 43-like n=1 Tax=Phragmites australis TaxID=29695 RepID=UPI002D78F22A|nr:zinc finger CCCH domain-containing protein 43-like [Phragmites australis]XP_062227675.1 zinc finger CCCH domain-containing protein 43-like [Phragmites australis]